MTTALYAPSLCLHSFQNTLLPAPSPWLSLGAPCAPWTRTESCSTCLSFLHVPAPSRATLLCHHQRPICLVHHKTEVPRGNAGSPHSSDAGIQEMPNERLVQHRVLLVLLVPPPWCHCFAPSPLAGLHVAINRYLLSSYHVSLLARGANPRAG